MKTVNVIMYEAYDGELFQFESSCRSYEMDCARGILKSLPHKFVSHASLVPAGLETYFILCIHIMTAKDAINLIEFDKIVNGDTHIDVDPVKMIGNTYVYGDVLFDTFSTPSADDIDPECNYGPLMLLSDFVAESVRCIMKRCDRWEV